jgi:adenylate kinase family enzyme
MRRVSVVGNSGSGKTALARRIAAALDAPFVELDAIHHLPDWEPIDPDEFLARIDELTRGDSWVIDGNYRPVVVDGPVWQRADTVVWLDLPRRTVMRQVTWRTLRRLVTRERLWNGNREPWTNIVSWDPEKSIVAWAWANHDKYVERFAAAMQDPALAHLEFVRLNTHAEASRWVEGLNATWLRPRGGR